MSDPQLPITNYEAVVAGHLCLDIIPTLPTTNAAQFVPGRLVEIGPAVLSTGGPVSNTGLALHKLGVNVTLLGKVGADLFGQAIQSLLETHGAGLGQGIVVTPDQNTSYTLIISPPGADRMFWHAPGCNTTFSGEDVPTGSIEGARLFHLGYPPLLPSLYHHNGTPLAALFQRVKAAGLTTSLDMCMPDPDGLSGRVNWTAVLASTLLNVDVFLPSVEETLFTLRRTTYEQLLGPQGEGPAINRLPPHLVAELGEELIAMGAAIVGLKCGERGLYVRTAPRARLEQMGRAQPVDIERWADREAWAPCFAVKVAGTTGSGDATIAGFLMGLLRGLSFAETLAAANAVGACCVEQPDAVSGVRTWPETAAQLAAGWPRAPLTLDAADWRWDEARQLWLGPNDPASTKDSSATPSPGAA